MNYFTELAALIFIALITVAWKINRAVAKEKRSKLQQGKVIALPSWPTRPEAVAAKKASAMLLLFITTFTFANTNANFNMDKIAGCSPLVINFTNTSAGGTIFSWDFGNGNTSSLNNPSATFITPGVYHVKLIVTNGSQSDSITKTIKVFNPPVVNFISDRISACLADTIHFRSEVTPGDAPITQYAWGFGNGIANSDSNASYKYSNTGTYSITLVVQDSNGCAANKTIPGYIHVFPSPHAVFTASPASSCTGTQLVSFTNNSTGTGLSYFWQLSDTVTSLQTNPSYTYHQQQYTVKLFVTDVSGCKDEASERVTALSLAAAFQASPITACAGQAIIFNNTSNFGGNAWSWNFGDGTFSNACNPAKDYANPGIYSVSLKVKAGACNDSITKVHYIHVTQGFGNTIPGFMEDSTISCGTALPVHFNNTTPGGSSFHWDFGNGDTSDVQNPLAFFNQPGSFTITLTVTDSNGCSIVDKVANLIQTAHPVAKFSADTTSCPGSGVHFTNLSAYAQSFQWNFGDGDTSSVISPVHHYQHTGDYTVTLTAFNRGGCDTSITKINYIHIRSMEAGFGLQNTFSPCPPFACTMQNQSESGLTYLWEFGDGYTDTATNPTHIYFYPGVYTVQLIASSRNGCVDTVTRHNLVTVQGPTGQFTVSPKTGCTPLAAIFSTTTSSNTYHLWWDLGDGTLVQDSLHIIHQYNMAGVFQPRLVLEDHVGCTVAYPTDSIIARNSPVAQPADTSVCYGMPVTISLDTAETYQWSPSRFLSCNNCNAVEVTPADSIMYIVTATNLYGCKSNFPVQVNVVSPPVLSSTQTLHLCKGDSIGLFAGNASNINWSPAQFLNHVNTFNPICTPEGSITYTVTAYNGPGCSATATVEVVVADKISVTTPGEIRICGSGKVQLSSGLNSGPDNGVHYEWSPAQYLDNANSANPVASLDSNTINFQLIATGGHCIADTQTLTVVVNPLPVIEVIPAITTAPFADVELKVSSYEILNYTWEAKDPLSCATCASTGINPSVSQTVYVTARDSSGCIAKDSVNIVVTGSEPNMVYAPNAFSPNGDGHNDVFSLYGHLNEVASLDIAIFNRWGERIFESQDPHFQWDGTFKGVKQNPGVYTYELQYALNDGKGPQPKSGSINLLR